MNKTGNTLWFDYANNQIINPDKGIVVPFNNAAAALQMKILLVREVPFEKYQTMH